MASIAPERLLFVKPLTADENPPLQIAGLSFSAAMITYTDSHGIDLDQLVTLFNSVGWEHRTADRDRLARLVRGSMWVISAWDESKLVGFARAVSDGATNAYVSTVAVLPEYQGRGIGREIMRHLIDEHAGIQFVLHANDRAYPFYLHLDLGFEPIDNMLRRPRKF